MALESFYGGRQGVSPVIRARFKYLTDAKSDEITYIDEAYGRAIAAANTDDEIDKINSETLEVCFRNPEYTDVWYGELAILDCENRNNPFHGRLYRRVLQRAETDEYDTTHGEYIGTIAGPIGGIPQTFVTKTLGDAFNENYSYTYINNNGNIVNGAKFLDEDDFLNNVPSNLSVEMVPGNVNDDIKYFWVNVVDETSGTTENANRLYLGFQVPYPCFTSTVESISWTENPSVNTKPARDNEQDKDKNFYWQNDFQIPEGIPGYGIGNIRKLVRDVKTIGTESKTVWKNVTDDSEILEKIYHFSKLSFNEEGALEIDGLSSAEISSSEEKYNTVWVYDIYVYKIKQDNSTTKGKQRYTCLLENFKEIKDIFMDSNNSLIIAYIDGSTEEIFFPHVQAVGYESINEEQQGCLYYSYKRGRNEDITKVPIINDFNRITKIAIDENTQKIYYKTEPEKANDIIENSTYITEGKYKTWHKINDVVLKTIKNMTLSKENGLLTVEYSNGDKDNFAIKVPEKGYSIAGNLLKDRLKAVAVLQNVFNSSSDDIESLAINIDQSIKYIDTILKNNKEINTIIFNKILKNNKEGETNRTYWEIEIPEDISQTNLIDLKEELWGNDFSDNPTIRKTTITKEINNEDKNFNVISFYPYEKGYIPIYNLEEVEVNGIGIVWTKIDYGNGNLESDNNWIDRLIILSKEILTSFPEHSLEGRFIIHEGYYFYYDFCNNEWKSAGKLGFGGQSSGNGSYYEIKIRQKTNDGWTEREIPSGAFFSDLGCLFNIPDVYILQGTEEEEKFKGINKLKGVL